MPFALPAGAAVLSAFGLTIFTGAFLLFMVQPLIARFILPWFGGSPAVWTTCMLFFQMVLLGGYAYAHLSIRRFAPRRQVIGHLALLAAALLLLPITPTDHWKPPDGTEPIRRILTLLTVCLGLPYFVLSATGPLMQAWFCQARPGVPPYRLYALSNLGSLLALVSYPFLVEPNISRQAQAGWWSLGFGLFALLAVGCGAMVWKRATNAATVPSAPGSGDELQTASPRLPTVPSLSEDVAAGSVGAANAAMLWFLLPACASILLLAVTNKICQDIAVIPFLWVLPLSLYLLSFVVSFDSPRWYARWFWMPMLVLALGAVLCTMLNGIVVVRDSAAWRPVRWLCEMAMDLSTFKIIGIHLGTLFVCCMVCHGEVYRLRPAAEKLTGYYLAMAAGGAFGGLFVAVLAPLLFTDYFELHTGLFSMVLLTAAVLFVDPKSPLYRGRRGWAWSLLFLATLGLGGILYQDRNNSGRDVVERSRTFYGVLRVVEYNKDDPERHELDLMHGTTSHGLQYVSPAKRLRPSSYYTATSGIGRTFENFPRAANRRVGVAGLGTGSLLAWSKAGDYFRFYEIDEEVHRLAVRRFSYIRDLPARVDVVMGDARLSMEREPGQRFDILVLDVFNSDAIPVHLLTREAFETYRRHLLPDGVIAIHISNTCLELEPVVLRAAAYIGFHAATIRDPETELDKEDTAGIPACASDWVLLTRNEAFLKVPAIADAVCAPGEYSSKITLWTDDESSLFRILTLEDDGWLIWLRKRLP